MVSDRTRIRLQRDLLSGVAFFLPLILLGLVAYGLVQFVYGTGLWFSGVLSVLGIHGTLATVLATVGAVVAVPLAPNPTVGGHLLAVKHERVSETGLTVRQALAILVTVGTSDPAVSEPPLSGLYNDVETVEDD